jgi:uncharacterized protein YndB with AHSA1/START domain
MSTRLEQSGTTVITPIGDREVTCERIFDAPRERVWRAFAEPDLVEQWWGREHHTLEIVRMEFERGGHWRFIEHDGNGRTEGFEGRYREVTPPTRFVQTFEWDGMPGYVTVDTYELEDLGDGRTRVMTTSIFHTAEERDGMLSSGMEIGLNESYAALDKLLQKMG